MLYLSRHQLRAIDRLAHERYHIPTILLMENAARNATAVAEQLLRQHQLNHALILAGGGNNGGDGLAIARHLHNRGRPVTIAHAIPPDKYTGDALINWTITQAMNLPTLPATTDIFSTKNFLIIDALFGTGLTQPPRPPEAALIDAANASGHPILAIDLPSGLDCDTGQPLGPSCIRASHTITFVSPKLGFANPASKQFTGPITTADIGAPPELIQHVLSLP